MIWLTSLGLKFKGKINPCLFLIQSFFSTARAPFLRVTLAGSILLGVWSCSQPPNSIPPRKVNLYQRWTLQPGDNLAGYRVQSSLGDIALDLRGNKIFMPFDGEVEPDAEQQALCLIVSSPEVPAYLFRLCGVKNRRLGKLDKGSSFGTAETMAFATLRRQADGTWAMVEPADKLLSQFLQAP